MNIHVPARAKSSSTAHLDCNFELENERELDFVNILKDEKLFFHFAPNESHQLISVSGINANVSVFLLIRGRFVHLLVHLLLFIIQDVEVTNLIGARSGQILFRLNRINPASTGSYACEVQTKDPALKYTSVKEMIVPDLTPRKENFVAYRPPQKENLVALPPPRKENIVTPAPQKENIHASPSPQQEILVVETPPPKIIEKDAEEAKPNTAHQNSRNSAVAIGLCAFITISINYVARAVTFLN